MQIRFSVIRRKSRALTRALAGSAIVLAAAVTTPVMAADKGVITPDKPHRYADVTLDTDRISGDMTVSVRFEHLGKQGDLFLVVMYNDDSDQMYMKTVSGWRRWRGDVSQLEPAATRTLKATETLSIVNDQQLLAGKYRVGTAYRVGSELVVNNSFFFEVTDADGSSLQRFSSADAMADYIREGMQNSGDAKYVLPMFTSVAFAEDAAASGTARLSTTNLQETGVDEADTIKTDGENLFVLNNCDFKPCLDVYGLDGEQATADKLAAYALDNTVAPDGMYLVQDLPGADQLITVSGMNQFYAWFDVWGWGNNTTEIEFFNADAPANLLSREKLTIDGALVSSRRVGDTLYVVTRYTPWIDDYRPLPVDAPVDSKEEDSSTNTDVLAKTTLVDLVPQVRDTRDEVMDLVQAQDCYLPVNAVDRNLNPSIITVTGIPIDNPTEFQSLCFLGGSETLYMTTESLYLATTSWDYERLAADALVYSPDHTTAIHKFALADGDITYQGSGEVKGHLGWSEDKKSFRMGEHDGYLNVVTSLGDTWDGTSSTRLTVLKESDFGNELETVSVIDGIGKPGEQLYAARFLGDRAYLVTFRLTDPLYVVDLSDQENPRIAGELEIDGYSDYLHPVSDTLLLGIGKDAIPDDGSSDFNGRGAWYQGVKLSLFDVSNPASPREIDAVVLGKRGTESAVLWDHHALSFVPGSGSEPARLAIPVQLHEEIPTWKGWDASEPSAWYDYTHTALYSFELSALGISQAGRLISEVDNGDDFVIALDDDIIDLSEDTDPGTDSPNSGSDEPIPVDLPTRLIAPVFSYYSDRSVLLDDAVFYIHDGEVFTSFWGEDRDVTD